MFTGIIAGVGRLESCTDTGGDSRLKIGLGTLLVPDPELGESISVNGACLTAQSWDADGFWADVSAETLRLTTLGDLCPGDPVNLERALAAGDRLGGHLVSGHVDGIGQVRQRSEEARSAVFHIEAPAALRRYIAAKGSVTLDGVSLTVNAVAAETFTVNIIPHTQAATILGSWAPGRRINIEVDVVARYLERLLSERHGQD